MLELRVLGGPATKTVKLKEAELAVVVVGAVVLGAVYLPWPSGGHERAVVDDEAGEERGETPSREAGAPAARPEETVGDVVREEVERKETPSREAEASSARPEETVGREAVEAVREHAGARAK